MFHKLHTTVSQHPNNITIQGRLHKGGNGARCTMAKSGGNFFVNNDAFAIMYYYMNAFITLH